MPSYRGPSRRYGASEDELSRAIDRARAGGGASPRTDLLEREDALDRQRAQFAMQPGVQRIGPAITSAPPDSPVRADATFEEVEEAAMRPRRFNVGGEAYEFNPNVAAAAQNASRRIQGMLGIEEDDARVSRLEGAGFDRKEATRQIYGRGGNTFEEQKELLTERQAGSLTLEDMKSANRMERETMLSSQRATLQQRRLDAQGQLSNALERVRSGDRAAARQLSAAEALMRSYDSQLDDLDRLRRDNALPSDPFTMRSMERTESGRAQLEEARMMLDSLDTERARIEGQREGSRSAVKDAAAGLPMGRDSTEQVVQTPPAPARAPARPPAARAPGAPAARPPARPAQPAAAAPAPRQPSERELFSAARERLMQRGVARPTTEQIMAEINRAARRDTTARR